MENPTYSFRETNLMIKLIQESQIKSKTVMSWSSRKKKEGIFYTVYFARKELFWDLCFISVYSVLNALSEYKSYISKTLLHNLLLLVSKIVERLQCILNHAHYFISILLEHQEYLKLLLRGRLYQCTCLPNDFSVGPRKPSC